MGIFGKRSKDQSRLTDVSPDTNVSEADRPSKVVRRPGWEVFHYAEGLQAGLDSVRPALSNACDGLITATTPVSGQSSVDYLGVFNDRFGTILGDLEQAFDPNVQQRAFGAAGVGGDESAIDLIVAGFVRGLGAILEESARLRRVTLDPAFEDAQRAAAAIALGLAVEMESFVNQVLRARDQLAGLSAAELAGEGTLEIELAFVPNIDPALFDRFIEGYRSGFESLQAP